MNLLLAITSDVLKSGFLTLLLGILVVFLGMSVIVFFVWLFGFLFDKFVNKKVIKPSKEPLKEESFVDDDAIPEDIKVAIIAAVTACYYSEPSKKCDFTVRKIKRLN